MLDRRTFVKAIAGLAAALGLPIAAAPKTIGCDPATGHDAQETIYHPKTTRRFTVLPGAAAHVINKDTGRLTALVGPRAHVLAYNEVLLRVQKPLPEYP